MSFHSKLSLNGIGRNFPELKKLWNNQKQLHSKRFAMKSVQKLSVALIQIGMSIVPFRPKTNELGRNLRSKQLSTCGCPPQTATKS